MISQAINIFDDYDIVCAKPSWLPEEVSKEVEEAGKKGVVISFEFSKAEKRVLRKRKPIKVSDWSEKHRVLTMSSLPGAWKNEVTPYLVGIMDAGIDPNVREIVVCKAPQTGVSEAVHNFVGYCIDRAPGPVLYVYPDKQTAEENSKDRILPMIESSKRLNSYLTGVADDAATLRINLQHMPIYLGWASSAARMANKPVKYAIADEIDKKGFYMMNSQNETTSLKLIDKRLITFRASSKYFKISTPTVETGNINIEMLDADVIFDFLVCCPDCGKLQQMKFENIIWEGGDEADPKAVESKNLAKYKCEHCPSEWNDLKRNAVVKWGHWASRLSEEEEKSGSKPLELNQYLYKKRPKKIAFHLPSWLSRFVSLSEIAAVYLTSLRSDEKGQEAKQDLANSHKAEPYRDERNVNSEKKILSLRDTRQRRIVPGGDIIAGLTAGVDTQGEGKGFWYEIRAWGWGLNLPSWGIREGLVETFEALEEVLWGTSYKDVDGNEYIVQYTVQDAMGHLTAEVYDFCIAHRGKIVPYQGKQRMNQPYKFTTIEYYPNTSKPIPGGLKLLQANTTYYKNALYNKLEIDPTDPGAWLYHSELTDNWARQMTSEFVNEKAVWELIPGRDNHGWDCSVYNLIAADVIGIKYWEKEEPIIEEPRGEKKKTSKGGSRW